MADSPGESGRRGFGVLVMLGQMAAVLAWLWPIGLGGKMPVGGDVTQFSIGLMAVLARALRGGRLPLWNDLWGYGFPGVGESQMGVFYPPHWLLYGLLPLEAGYTASLVLHTLWGSLGASWCARTFGVSRLGSALAGFSWAACGFYLIHLSHQWGYTTGSWMPWAWGLAWSVLRGGGPARVFGLAAVLSLQLLPGHFQLAFCTQVGIVVLAASCLVERLTTGIGGYAGVFRVVAGLAGAFPLAAMQLWPTLRLARLASPRRDFEYLSGFAASPLHLVTFVAPGLFERSPLWRPIVWDILHTSPEEHLAYVGLVPLFLACGAVLAGWRRSPAVRALAVVGLATLWLALGPYVPGYGLLMGLPGFSFFRAPARWTLATSLALSLLAGLGFDGLLGWTRVRLGLSAFVVVCAACVLGAVGLVELAMVSVEGSGVPALALLYTRTLDALPWGEKGVFAVVVTGSRAKNTDRRVAETLARQGVTLRDAPRPVFRERRWTIYRQEAGAAALVGLALVATLFLEHNRRAWQAALLVLTFADLWIVGRDRRVDHGPIASLIAQSPVLTRLAAQPGGLRTIDPMRNLPMVAGAAPVSAYRTLDLPAIASLETIAGHLPRGPFTPPLITAALRDVGADVRVLDPLDGLELQREKTPLPGVDGVEPVDDPSLAGWLLGRDWVRQQGPWARTFRVGRVRDGSVRAWLLPLTVDRSAAILGTWSGQIGVVLNVLRIAEPLKLQRPDPERRELSLRAEGPQWVLISELADPQWEAVWSGSGGVRAATVERAFGKQGKGAWIAVKVPGAGDWVLSLTYRGRDVQVGLAVSALAWALWAGGLAWVSLRWSAREKSLIKAEGERE